MIDIFNTEMNRNEITITQNESEMKRRKIGIILKETKYRTKRNTSVEHATEQQVINGTELYNKRLLFSR